jgi:hypothetical protein
MTNDRRHYEDAASIPASPKVIFDFVNDHSKLSVHMNKSSWIMGGGRMETELDEGKGQKVGSHIHMHGKILGINLSLDEIVTRYEPPSLKVWETVGDPKLLVIGPYQMGLQIEPREEASNLKVFIDYDLPMSAKTRWLGYLFGSMYAKWCVQQMLATAKEHFKVK